MTTAKRRKTSAQAPVASAGIAQWFQSPAVRFVASGIATAVLGKIAINLADRYPQISQLLRDGLDSVEGKLADFSGAGADSEEPKRTPVTSSRHRRSANANLATH